MTPSDRDLVFGLIGNLDLFSDADGQAYMNIPFDDGASFWIEVHPIRSTAGRNHLTNIFIDKHGKPPRSQGLKEGTDALVAQAARVIVTVGIRTMPYKKGFALDLCNERWERVIVTPSEWSVTHQNLAIFSRGSGAKPLPTPISGGTLDKLRDLLNILSDDDWVLILAWLVFALQSKGPYPVLALQGEHGSSKSTLAKILVLLIDPNTAPLLSLPKSVQDLMVVARSRHVLAFDNISILSPEMKDAICRLATGAGYAGRKLYTDNETIVWNCSRPIILNGIDNLLVADDLADRAISITLPYIPEHRRKREGELMEEINRLRVETLGVLLNAAAYALEAPSPPADVQLPRMADFAHFAGSASCTWGVKYKEFIEIYRNNRHESTRRSLDTDSLAGTIRSFLSGRGTWQGTKKELLQELEKHSCTSQAQDLLPNTAKGLGSGLRRLAPALRSVGIEITDLGRVGKGYQVRLAHIGSPADVRSERCERSTLLKIEDELKKRERIGGTQRSQRSQPSPPDKSSASGESP